MLTGVDTQASLVTSPRWDEDADIVHGLTTRHFAPAGTAREEIAALIRSRANLGPGPSVLLGQSHGRRVAWVDEAAVSRAEGGVIRIPDTDAAMTNIPGVLLTVSVADCVPILAFDRARRLAGAAHAGWRGTVRKIATRLMREMAERGAVLEQTEVWLGPAIGACCFEVGADVLEEFKATTNWWPAINLGERRVDLPLVNRIQLARAGVPPDQMQTSGLCTRCHAGLLHSHRAEPQNPGRNVGFIALRNSP